MAFLNPILEKNYTTKTLEVISNICLQTQEVI